MNNNYWSSKENKPVVFSKLQPSPAKGYVSPEIKKIATKINCEDEDFIPRYNSKNNYADLLINLKNNSEDSFKDLKLTYGSLETVDCGIEIEIPSGYKIRAESSVPGIFLTLQESKRIKVNLVSFCKEEVILHHKQVIGKLWIEPIYFFEWI